jgi:molybdenum cofactor biosynthesis enzyme MoaA
MLGDGLEELTLTTNATQLSQYANDLAKAGVRKVNVSLDTIELCPFRRDRPPKPADRECLKALMRPRRQA